MKKILYTLLLIVNYLLSISISIAIPFLFRIFFVTFTVTRSCSARYTYVFRPLHVRVPRVTRTCNAILGEAFENK